MNRTLLLMVLLATAGITQAHDSAHADGRGRSIDKVNGGITAQAGQAYGDLSTVNGDVTVGVGSHVKGGIRIEKPRDKWGVRWGKPKLPRVVIGPDAVVEGALVFEREVTLYVHQSARIGNVSGATAQRYNTPAPPKD